MFQGCNHFIISQIFLITWVVPLHDQLILSLLSTACSFSVKPKLIAPKGNFYCFACQAPTTNGGFGNRTANREHTHHCIYGCLKESAYNASRGSALMTGTRHSFEKQLFMDGADIAALWMKAVLSLLHHSWCSRFQKEYIVLSCPMLEHSRRLITFPGFIRSDMDETMVLVVIQAATEKYIPRLPNIICFCLACPTGWFSCRAASLVRKSPYCFISSPTHNH